MINLNKQAIGKASVRSLITRLTEIANQWNLNLSHVKDFNTARRILTNSVNNN